MFQNPNYSNFSTGEFRIFDSVTVGAAPFMPMPILAVLKIWGRRGVTARMGTNGYGQND